MRKLSTRRVMGSKIFKGHQLTIGLDLGDRWSFYCVLNERGEVVREEKLPTTPDAMKRTFEKLHASRIVLETGTHSPWISRLLTELGHEVIVAHAQKVHLITKSSRKDDRHDARTLARLGRIDPQLLGPVRHRSAQAQIHLTVIRARAELVSARTALINAARGLAKSYGERLPKRGSQQVGRELAAALSIVLREALEPLLREVESLNERIREYDQRIEQIAKEVYPEVALLKQVKGVGTQIALTYRLTIDDPHRFSKSREVGCFLRVATRTQELWTKRTTEENQQRGRPLSTHDDGAGRALHSGSLWRRQRSAALGVEACRARREKRQETGDRCGSAKVGDPAASVVGDSRGVRTTTEHQPSHGRRSLTSFCLIAELDRRVRVTATNSWPDFLSERWEQRSILR